MFMHFQLSLKGINGFITFSQVISYIILEEAEYKLRDAISSKEKVLYQSVCHTTLLCNVLLYL